MTKKQLLSLKVGDYHLTDNIYEYSMSVSMTAENQKCFLIKLKDSILSQSSIFMVEDLVNDSITALSGVGSLRIHSDDVYDILKKLKFKQ
jgi:hypothetical protein